jgi:uncharacterized protein YndB with AHSA1/START domain
MGTSSNVAGSATFEVVITRVFDAPRALVFNAWTQPEMLAKWFGPKGFSATTIQNDVRPGGAYDFHMRGDNYDDHWTGTYREVVPPERLAFTWPAGPQSLVTLLFEDLSGKTRLTLRHSGFASEDARARHQNGWNSALDCLAEYLEVAHE